MSKCCSWLTRPGCCRRQSKHSYIYLYSPTMADSSSSSTSHCCLVCILFGLCLTFVVILAAVVIYHLNSTNSILPPGDTNLSTKASPNTNRDACENFYKFVCHSFPDQTIVDDEEKLKQKWTHIRHEFHHKIMSISHQNDHITSMYQLCENQSPELLMDELERYFKNFSQKEPYRSHLTLFNRTYLSQINPPSLFSLVPNPFFNIQSFSSNTSMITRVHRRPLPITASIFPNSTILNQTAFAYLTRFDHDYSTLLSNEKELLESYEQEYDQDSLIIKRILTFSNYDRCLSSLKSNTGNGLEKLIELLNHFLHSRLHNYNPNSIDKEIRILDQITDNHTLVENLQRIRTDLKTIDQVILFNKSQNSCISDLLDQLLDKRIQSNELILLKNLSSDNRYFLSNDWPFLMMLYNRLLKTTHIDTLINFAYFDYYRAFVYPYYQPHISHGDEIDVNHPKNFPGYTYETNYPNLSCHIKSCFDIFNCYHPSLLNRLVDDQNQTWIHAIEISAESIINRLRLLTEQSDHLYSEEKKGILNELNQIRIHVGHYSPLDKNFSREQFSSYVEYVQFYSSIPYDQQERSYFTEPIYYPLNHTLFLPFGFLSISNSSIEYSILKLLLKILRSNIQSNPYHIDCLLKSTDDEQDPSNSTKISSTDEDIAYLILRSKYLSEQGIILDEYLWPFMSASFRMKNFLIQYTENHFCRNLNGYDSFRNTTYLIDDIHLIFQCQEASFIKQSRCTVN